MRQRRNERMSRGSPAPERSRRPVQAVFGTLIGILALGAIATRAQTVTVYNPDTFSAGSLCGRLASSQFGRTRGERNMPRIGRCSRWSLRLVRVKLPHVHNLIRLLQLVFWSLLFVGGPNALLASRNPTPS
jgi:hypothetical protein